MTKIFTNRSGVVLIIAMWILVILALMAYGLGRQSQIDLALSKFSLGKVQAKASVWAGMVYAMNQMRLDSNDDESRAFDNLYYCGYPKTSPVSPEEAFERVELEQGYFSIGFSTVGRQETAFGFRDEQAKLNLNAATLASQDVFIEFFKLKGAGEDEAKEMVHALIDWIDADDNLSAEDSGAETDYYAELARPYRAKNNFLESVPELLLVRGFDPDIFERIQADVTVFPLEGYLRINFETAPMDVLKALARSFSGDLTNTEEGDADSLVEKMIDYRAGEDGQAVTPDDRLVDFNEMTLNMKEKVLAQKLRSYQAKATDLLAVRVRGGDKLLGVESEVEAVIDRRTFSIMAWKRL